MFLVALYFSLSKTYEQIAMKFYGGVQDGERNKSLHFGSDLDHHDDF